MLLEHIEHFDQSEIVVLMLAYTLAPDAKYPSQLSEAAMALNYLLEIEKIPPSMVSLCYGISTFHRS